MNKIMKNWDICDIIKKIEKFNKEYIESENNKNEKHMK